MCACGAFQTLELKARHSPPLQREAARALHHVSVAVPSEWWPVWPRGPCVCSPCSHLWVWTC